MSSRWIDADAWWKAVQKHYTDGDCADDDRYELGINVGITKSRNVMMSAPSIDIVRCKECKHNYNTAINHGKMNPRCDFTDWKLTENDFCSRGEREDE